MVMEILAFEPELLSAMLERTDSFIYSFNKYLFSEYLLKYFLSIYYVLNIVLNAE